MSPQLHFRFRKAIADKAIGIDIDGSYLYKKVHSPDMPAATLISHNLILYPDGKLYMKQMLLI